MKLTPFGFVSRSEELLKEALALPPVGGGKWVTRRIANLITHSSSLQVSVIAEGGDEKTAVVLNSRLTGGARDGGIQGWAEYPGSGEREAFILREADADRAMEEIFEIIEKTLTRVPEWDQSALPPRPQPAPRSFEPLIPSIQNSEPPAAEAEAFDPQAMVDAMLSPDSFDEPPPASPEEAVPVAAEETPAPPAAAAEETPAEEVGGDESKAKKSAKAKKPKA